MPTVRPPLVQLRRVGPLAAVVAASAIVYLAGDSVVARWPGPPGFEVVTTPRGGPPSIERAAWLLAPEVIPALPVGGDRTARAVLLAHTSGRYTFNFGASCDGRLLVDGKPIAAARNQRAWDAAVDLGRGLHTIAVELHKGEAEGSVMLALRPPGRSRGSRLLGPGDVVAAPLEAVTRRLGGRPDRVALAVAVMPWLPAAATVLALLVAAVAIGRSRLARSLAYLRSLAADESLRPLFTAAAFLLLAAPALRPLLSPGYYECHEEESFIVRLGQFASATAGGVPMGRWFPDPVLGRGYPFLCLYAPGLYLLAWPLLALGAGALTVMKLESAAMILVAGGATYGLVRRRASRPAALVAATLVLYAPYFHYDLYVRGALAETLGFAAFPLALWALDRALDGRLGGTARGWFEVAALALALGLLGSSHNITGYFATWFLGLWALVRIALRSVRRDGILRAAAGGTLAFLLTVFYALPAMRDKQLVWIELITTGFYSYARWFTPLSQILFGRKSYDITLGAGVLLALVAGAAATVRARWRGPLRASPFALLGALGSSGVLLAVLLLTRRPVGEWVFSHVPLAKFVEFPWRIFLFAACTGAVMAGPAIDGWLEPGRARAVVGGLIAVAIAVGSQAFVGPPSPLLRRHNHEVEFLHALPIDYVTSMNEYLPRTVRREPPRFGMVARALDPATAITLEERGPGWYRVVSDAKAPSAIEFDCHWFPGWTATVDGAFAPIGPGIARFDDGGLVRVAVPAGRHEVALRYQRTPFRLACDLVSLGALLVVLALLGLAARQRWREARATVDR